MGCLQKENADLIHGTICYTYLLCRFIFYYFLIIFSVLLYIYILHELRHFCTWGLRKHIYQQLTTNTLLATKYDNANDINNFFVTNYVSPLFS